MVRTGEGFGLATVSTVLMEDGTLLYLETDRDVTALFADREFQYGIYRRWMAGLLFLQGLGCYLIAVWLLRPLGRLSRASRRIAGGNLEVRAKVETGDEIGQLAEDFNHMADNLEKQFKELEDAARRQEDFIGSFAHELKTPLTSMIGYADMPVSYTHLDVYKRQHQGYPERILRSGASDDRDLQAPVPGPVRSDFTD